MKIGIAGPISLGMLSKYVNNGDKLPPTYSFPLIGYMAELLVEKGHEVCVFALSHDIEKPQVFKGERLTIHIGRYRRARHYICDFFQEERKSITDAIKDDPCDIIHAHWTYEFAIAALKSGYPTLITAHDAPFNVLRYVPPFFLRFERLLMAFFVCNKAKYLTAVSPYVMEHYKKLLLYRHFIKMIPNGLPDKIFDKYKNQNTKLSNMITIATIAQGWGIRKNTKAALRAFSIFYKENDDSRLLMFGSGHGPQGEASRWARKNHLEKGVEFIGDLVHNELIEYLSREVNILIHPAIEEACPVSVIEAMALGIPVIGGIISGGVPYVLGYGKAGVLVNVRSPGEIYKALVRMTRDRDEMLILGERARKYALENYKLSNVIDEYIKLYNMILNQQTIGGF